MSDTVLRFDFMARDQASSTFEKVGRESDGLQAKLGKFGKFAGTALVGATAAFGGLAVAGVSMGVKTAAAMEQAQVGFTTLLGSGQKAQAFLSQLKTFAAATPFDLPGLVDSSRLLIGVGLSAKDTMAVLQNFGDAAGAVGVSQEAFQRIMLATSQAISAGKFQAGDLNQITEAGIPIWKILSEAMGLPVTKIRELSSQGKLLSSDVLPLLDKQMHKDYGGAMAKQSQTLNGMWSTFMDTLNQGLGNAIMPMIPALDKGLAGATNVLSAAFKQVPAAIKIFTGALTTAKTYIKNDIQPVFSHIFDGIKTKIPHIDISGIGKNFIQQSSTWAQSIITGVEDGFQHGNWSVLGKILGDAVGKTFSSVSTVGGQIELKVMGWIKSVDWLEAGKQAALYIVPFAIGFVNNLLMGVIDAAKKHPLDVVLFIVSIIPIGKLATAFEPLRAAIEALPLGKAFTGLMEKTAAPVWDAVAGFIRNFASKFGEGFVEMFPTLEKALDRGLVGLGDGIRLRIMYMVDAAHDFVDGIATGMGRGFAKVVQTGALLVRQMLSPYVNIAKWLVKPGTDFVDGLITGVSDRLVAAGSKVLQLITKIRVPFNDAVGWLRGAGRNVVSGVINGIADRFGSLASTVTNSIQKIRSPFSKAGTWLFQAGRQILSGLFQGMVDGVSAAGHFASSVGGKIVSAVKGYFGIHSPSTVMMGIGTNLISSVFKAMVDHNPVPVMGRIFGGMPEALGQLVDKGLISIKNLPGKALNALEGLGGAIGGKIGSLLGLGGGGGSVKLGGNLSAAERWIIMHESGGRTTAKNPTSTAFGLGQLLIANREHYGKILGVSPNTTNYAAQLAMFRMYVHDRYGTAQNAQRFWEAHGWYDSGGMASGVGFMGKRTIAPERVLSPRQTMAFEDLVKVISRNYGQGQSSPAGEGIDYAALGDHVVAAFLRAGVTISMDGRAVGQIQGKRTNLLTRGG